MLAGHEMSVSSYWHRLLQIPTMESDWPIRPSDSFYLICHQMAGKNPTVKQADFRSFYTCLTASRCKGFERILIKGLAPIFDIIRSNSLYVLDFLFVQQSLIRLSTHEYQSGESDNIARRLDCIAVHFPGSCNRIGSNIS